jgi:phosphate uptake regulator
MTRALMHQLDELRERVVRIATGIEALLAGTEDILQSGNTGDTRSLAELCERSAQMAQSAEAEVVTVIAEAEVFGDDIHLLLALLRVNNSLGRVARSVGRVVNRVAGLDPNLLPPYGKRLAPILGKVKELVGDAAAAFQHPADRVPLGLVEKLRSLDRLASEVVSKLVVEVQARSLPVTAVSQFFFVLNDLERIAGHTKSIAAAFGFRTASIDPVYPEPSAVLLVNS